MKKLIFISIIFITTFLSAGYEYCQYEGQRDINSYRKKCYYSCNAGSVSIVKRIEEICPVSITLMCDYTGSCHIM